MSGHKVDVALAGEPLSDSLRTAVVQNASRYRIREKDLTITEHAFGLSQQDMDNIIQEIYNNTNNELDENQALLESMQARLEDMSLELARLKEQVAAQAKAEADTLTAVP